MFKTSRKGLLLMAVLVLAAVLAVIAGFAVSQPQVFEVRGIVHCHSSYSDGSGTVAEIARAANDATLDYLILTDHDKLDALKEGKEGWHGSTLVLVGQETTSPAGHILTFGVPADFTAQGLDTRAILDKITESGGFSFLAHPVKSHEPWKDWNIIGCQGLEIVNLAEKLNDHKETIKQMGMEMFFAGRINYNPIFKLALSGYPGAQLEHWDKMTVRQQVPMLGGSDAHARLVYMGKVYKLPPYKETFLAMQTHLLLPEPLNKDMPHDRKLIYDALRKGHSYIGYDLLADTRGFRFQAEGRGSSVIMGDSLHYEKGMNMTVIAPSPKGIPANRITLKILRNGFEVAKGDGKGLAYKPDRPGTYRAEAWLTTGDSPQVWVLSNPIYLVRAE